MSAESQHDWPLELAHRLNLRKARAPVRPGLWRRVCEALGGPVLRTPIPDCPYVFKETVLFLHVPKSGGTSFDTFLTSHFWGERILPVELQYKGWLWKRGDKCCFQYLHLATEYDALKHRRKALHIVTLLRDPIKRILSEYWYLKSGYDLGLSIPEVAADVQHRWDHARQLPLGEWVRIPAAAPGAYPRNLNLATFTCGSSRLRDASPKTLSRLLQRAKRVLRDELAFVGITEEYARSKELFCRTFGLPPHCAEGEERRNVTGSEKRCPPDDEALAVLRRDNAWDVELYEYARELFEERYKQFQHRLWDDPLAIRISPNTDRYPRTAGERRLEAGRLRGSGLYREEPNASGWSHRWTGLRPVTRINFGAKLPVGADLTVRIEVAGALNEQAWNSLAPRFDGQAPSHIDRRQGVGTLLVQTSHYQVTFDMASRPLHELELQSVQGQPDSPGDDRALGVAIQEIFIEWTRSAARQLAGGQPPEGLGPIPDDSPAAPDLRAAA